VTAFSPTFVATPLDILDKQLDTLFSLKQNYAVMLPAHLEGPFISKVQKGAQPESAILDEYNESEHKCFFEKHRSHIGIVTLCPSVKGVDRLTKLLVSLGIKVQAGHDNSNYNHIQNAMACGLDGVTHLGCASSMMKRDDNLEKHLGLTETALYDDNLAVELIVDGKHLAQDVVDMVHKFKADDKIIYISDSLSTAGMPAGEYMLGDTPVVSDGTVSYLKNMTTLAGSVTNLYKELHLALDNGVPLEKALYYVAINPRRYLSLPTEIKVGEKADFVIFDKDGNLKKVVLGGTVITK
jgi:N-acetylglucosamine-6-phosphate deacetylase